MRIFTCLPIQTELREKIQAVQARLESLGANVKWVEPENFHLTVTFIGDVDNTLLPDISSACETISLETSPFRFRVRGVSVFPKRGPQIKTVLMAVTAGGEDWKALVRRAEPWFTPFGAAKEGGLVPHITLGRVKGQEQMDALREAIAAEVETDCGEQEADRLVLIESVLDPRGATYTERGAWQFRQSF